MKGNTEEEGYTCALSREQLLNAAAVHDSLQGCMILKHWGCAYHHQLPLPPAWLGDKGLWPLGSLADDPQGNLGDDPQGNLGDEVMTYEVWVEEEGWMGFSSKCQCTEGSNWPRVEQNERGLHPQGVLWIQEVGALRGGQRSYFEK